ncbi:hypothetical protein [Aminobacter sp. HY435]|uniref:hypothetical protein n=1 Tax=Aminobacter sp. HY435 TaxID=2970917 RepID=UPI0022B99836|nr:hypothetical protein [Aminobacter sp. HY435]
MMRKAGKILAVIAIAVGAVWMLQGLGVAEGSFMTDDMDWFWIGLVVAAAGVLGLFGLSRPAR